VNTPLTSWFHESYTVEVRKYIYSTQYVYKDFITINFLGIEVF